jgi:hypothetical protein
VKYLAARETRDGKYISSNPHEDLLLSHKTLWHSHGLKLVLHLNRKSAGYYCPQLFYLSPMDYVSDIGLLLPDLR